MPVSPILGVHRHSTLRNNNFCQILCDKQKGQKSYGYADVVCAESLWNEVDRALDVDAEDVPVELVEAEGEVARHALAQEDRVNLVPADVQGVALEGTHG